MMNVYYLQNVFNVLLFDVAAVAEVKVGTSHEEVLVSCDEFAFKCG